MRYTTQNLINDLQRYQPFGDRDERDKAKILTFLKATPAPFVRETLEGHVTGSCFLLSPDLKSVLLAHHATLNRWLQFGGHADGEANIKNVALREGEEESGIAGIKLLSDDIFDLDIHVIPDNPKKSEPEHLHYDIRYLCQAPHLDFVINSESNALKWVGIDDIFDFPVDETLIRMARKWRAFLAQ